MKHHFQLSKIAASLAVMGGAAFLSANAMAATPLAGTNISNVATASYLDNTGTERVVTSNEVKTIVSQVGSFTLVADRQAETTPNGKVEMHHVLTNTGNGTDTFTFDLENLTGGTFDFESGKFAVYLDKNLDGIPDNNTDLAKVVSNSKPIVELKAGESVGLIVVATTPNAAAQGQSDQLKLVATAGTQNLYLSGKHTASNTDTVKITTGAVISITKAASINSAKVGDLIEYTLTFKNTGNQTAANVAIFDILPDNVVYFDGKDPIDNTTDRKSRYSGRVGYLTKDDLADDNFIVSGQKILLNIPTLAANTTGTLKFYVQVLSSTSNSVNNTAYVDPDGKGNTPYQPEDIPTNPENPTDPLIPSNESKVPVVGSYKGSINDTKSNAFGDKETAVGGDDKIILSGQKDGVPVVFGGIAQADGNKVVVHNSGNTVDTYNLTIDRTALSSLGFENTAKLPAGTIIDILKSDGATPVTDTNGDGIVDTGPIQPNANAEFVVRVTLPNGSTHQVGYSFLVNSTSTSNKVVDTLKLGTGPITANKVDLVNRQDRDDPSKDLGTGPDDGKPVQDVMTPPGTPITFDATIKNNGNVPDNYVITVPDVPTDWKVEIFEKDSNGNCTSTKVTNSGNIKNGESKSFCVTVTPPAGTPAGTEKNIEVEIKSPSTGTSDSIVYTVEVAQQRGLTFTPDRQGQVAPGGTVEYVHTLTNTGNVTEGAVSWLPNSRTPYNYPLEIDFSSTMKDVNTSIYVDLDNDGQADTFELVTGTTLEERKESLAKLLATINSPNTTNTKPGLSPNESIQIIVKVQTPATATAGEKDTTILTFTPTGTGASAPVSVTDLTTVNLGQVRLTKMQAELVDCKLNGKDITGSTTWTLTEVKSLSFTQGNLTAKPGQCVYYSVVAVNEGNVNADKVIISDMVPSYTSYIDGSAKSDPENSGKLTTPSGSGKEVKYDIGTLTPAQSATLYFGVQLDK